MFYLDEIPMMDREVVKETVNEPVLHPKMKEDRAIELRYTELAAHRQPYVLEARNLSQAIIPYLYPPEGTEDIFSLQSANQSLIAKGVVNMSKELGGTILPPNAKFFENNVMPDVVRDSIAEIQSEQQGSEVASVLSQINNKLIKRDAFIRQTIRETPDVENFFQAMQHLIVAGTVCFFKPNLKTSKIYTIEDFSCSFDSTGELVEVVVRDTIHVSKFLPEQLENLFGTSDLEKYEEHHLTNINVFTRQVRRFDRWEIQVEICGKRFAEMEGFEDLEAPPFIVLPFFLFRGRNYGVSWCSFLRGDIIQYENLSLSVNELAKAAAKVVVMVPPESKVNQAELSQTAGLSFVFGSPAPIEMVYADISKNLQSVVQVYQMSQQVIQSMFLLTEAIQRDAERVTKEEIDKMYQGLMDILAGLFLSLARRFQYPYIKRIERLMVKEGLIEPLPEGLTQLVLTAGLETLQAQDDLQNQDQLMARLQLFGPEAMQAINFPEYATRTANYLKVPTDNLILTPEQVQGKQGIQQLAMLAQKLGPQGPQMMAGIGQALLQQLPQKGGQIDPAALLSMIPTLTGASQGSAGQQGGQQPQESPTEVTNGENPNG